MMHVSHSQPSSMTDNQFNNESSIQSSDQYDFVQHCVEFTEHTHQKFNELVEQYHDQSINQSNIHLTNNAAECLYALLQDMQSLHATLTQSVNQSMHFQMSNISSIDENHSDSFHQSTDGAVDQSSVQYVEQSNTEEELVVSTRHLSFNQSVQNFTIQSINQTGNSSGQPHLNLTRDSTYDFNSIHNQSIQHSFHHSGEHSINQSLVGSRQFENADPNFVSIQAVNSSSDYSTKLTSDLTKQSNSLANQQPNSHTINKSPKTPNKRSSFSSMPPTPTMDSFGISEVTRSIINQSNRQTKNRDSVASLESLDSLHSNDPSLPSTLYINRTVKRMNKTPLSSKQSIFNQSINQSANQRWSTSSYESSNLNSPSIPHFTSALARTPHTNKSMHQSMNDLMEQCDLSPARPTQLCLDPTIELPNTSLSVPSSVQPNNVTHQLIDQLVDEPPQLMALMQSDLDRLPAYLKTVKLDAINESIEAINQSIKQSSTQSGVVDMSPFHSTRLSRQALTLALTQLGKITSKGGNMYAIVGSSMSKPIN